MVVLHSSVAFQVWIQMLLNIVEVFLGYVWSLSSWVTFYIVFRFFLINFELISFEVVSCTTSKQLLTKFLYEYSFINGKSIRPFGQTMAKIFNFFLSYLLDILQISHCLLFISQGSIVITNVFENMIYINECLCLQSV